MCILLNLPVILGLVAPAVFLRVPFTAVGLVPFVTVAAAETVEVVLAGPAVFLSGNLVWFLDDVLEDGKPTGFLGTAPAPDGFAEGAGCFLSGAVFDATLLEGFPSSTGRRDGVPG